MPILTLLTDFGLRDHYVAAVKARVLKDCPNATLVDISHLVDNGNIAQGGFLLRSVFATFPKGTVHLVAIGAASTSNQRFIAMSLEGHYFIGADNGLWSLISDKTPQLCVELPKPDIISSSFPAKFLFAPAAAELLNGTVLSDLGNSLDYGQLERKLFRSAILQEDRILGAVIYVDGFGNLITNISYEAFEKTRVGRKYEITFGYERFSNIHLHYNSQEYGDCVMIFNSQNYLEIAINQGNAAQLLGLSYNSPVNVVFS